MNIKKNLNDMTGAAAELREGMKGVWRVTILSLTPFAV